MATTNQKVLGCQLLATTFLVIATSEKVRPLKVGSQFTKGYEQGCQVSRCEVRWLVPDELVCQHA